MSRRVAYLTMADSGAFVTDYELSYAAMAARGIVAEPVPWRNPEIDWDVFDAVYICAPWDYPQHIEEFLIVLERIDRSRARLVNDLGLVRWNLDKTYLRDLGAGGVAIVPSIWGEAFDATEASGWFQRLGTDTLVIKPVVGANAQGTYVLEGEIDAETETELAAVFAARRFFVQPFIHSIRTCGEYSLFFLGGAYSHAIRKVPKRGDFRCQEEHGARILGHTASSPLVTAAARILADLRPRPVYMRADFVLDERGLPLLMELELVEPSLYLRMDDAAAERFATAFDAHLRAATRA